MAACGAERGPPLTGAPPSLLTLRRDRLAPGAARPPMSERGAAHSPAPEAKNQ